jgi:tetratricopeptide (TPR) repeat protein
MKHRLLLVIAALLVNCPSRGGENQSPGRPVPTKKLWGTQYSEASSAGSRADLLRAELEKRMSAARSEQGGKKAPSPSAGQFDAEAAEVARAYQEVIDRYPHTEIAADCALRLSGLYQFLGKFDEAAELSAKTASEFAGTPEGLRAIFNTGLIHAQARHDPAEAAKWFARIPRPTKPAGAPYDFDDKLYLSAQEQLTKCELRLGDDRQAKQRMDELKQVFPEYGDDLDRFHQFEVVSRDSTATQWLTVSVETRAKLLIGLGFTLILSGLSLVQRPKQKGVEL